jgi:hypothetical protein
MEHRMQDIDGASGSGVAGASIESAAPPSLETILVTDSAPGGMPT